MATVFLALGSNIGNRDLNYTEAVSMLGRLENVKVKKESSRYLTPPAGGPEQEDYLNGVVKIETVLSPQELLKSLKKIERDMGREEAAERNLPRPIDIDIALYGDLIINSEDLAVPHPRMHKREFVLKGLAEISPELKHPILGRTIEELYKECRSLEQ